MTMAEFRRHDQRDAVRGHPFWMSSKLVSYDDGEGNVMDDNETVLLSFPKANLYRIDAALLEITEAFDGTPVLTIGNGTIPNFYDTTGATVTVGDADSIVTTAVAIPGSTGRKDCQSIVGAAPITFVGALTTCPVIYATLTATGAVTQGKMKLHVQISMLEEQVV